MSETLFHTDAIRWGDSGNNPERNLLAAVVQSALTDISLRRDKNNKDEIDEAFDFLLDWMHRRGSIYKDAFGLPREAIAKMIMRRVVNSERNLRGEKKVYYVPAKWRDLVFRFSERPSALRKERNDIP